MKTYLVQTWNKNGSLREHYEVSLPNVKEVRALRGFLKKSAAKVLVLPSARKKAR